MNVFFKASTVALGLAFCVGAWADGHEGGDMAAAMEAMQKAAVVGENHKELATVAGTWSATIKSWMDPSAPPMVNKATVERTMDLGGRVMVENWSGDFGGMPFEGRGRTGFDNVTNQYWSTWTDNMSTGLMVMQGNYDEDMEAMVFHGEVADPISGEMKKSRTVSKMEGDTETMTMYEFHGDEEVKIMEITAVRR